jgi:predicted transcriptional regulator
MDFKKELSKINNINVLNSFRIGCDEKNYIILNYLLDKKISIIKDIQKVLDNLSPMPANRRLNQLASVGLIERKNQNRNISITKIGLRFIKIIQKEQKIRLYNK